MSQALQLWQPTSIKLHICAFCVLYIGQRYRQATSEWWCPIHGNYDSLHLSIDIAVCISHLGQRCRKATPYGRCPTHYNYDCLHLSKYIYVCVLYIGYGHRQATPQWRYPTHYNYDSLYLSKYMFVHLLVGCWTSQQHTSVSQGQICLDNYTWCHTEIDADHTFSLTQSQYTDTMPTSPNTDPIMPGTWHGSHWSANF